ncbi:MAG: hypothetical protein ABIH52_02900 [Candidatus Aenigmatarchaeota archaeon]
MVRCKKCGYYDKKVTDVSSQSGIIVGFCRLRGKFITDQSINNDQCKDKAVIDINPKDFERRETEITEKKRDGPVTF